MNRPGISLLSLLLILILALFAGYVVYKLGILTPVGISLSPQTTPPSLTEMCNFALGEINSERSKHGLSNVTLSPVDSAQGHAEEMVANKYLSHWDLDGFKPYMRYTLAGGKGLVEENAAYMSSNGKLEAYASIHQLNYDMVYNDSSSNWGHRDNLLNPNHNRVSIGVAFDGSTLALVQDFEDFHLSSAVFTVSGSVVDLSYTSTTNGWKPSHIDVYYDPLPTPLTRSQVSASPYNDGYDSGTLVGGVVPKGYFVTNGVTVTATSWVNSSPSFKATFDLSNFFTRNGKGVYTFYVADSTGFYTSISVWNRYSEQASARFFLFLVKLGLTCLRISLFYLR